MKSLDIYDVDTVIVGGGVIGIAIARALAMSGKEVLLLEKNNRVGEETSARNSEVIHAGIYYEQGSLKARHCVQGRRFLYDYCMQNSVPYRRCGKLIVAANDRDLARLSDIVDRAHKNGVDDLILLDSMDVKRLEPELHAKAGLLSPSTGIVDSHALMQHMLGEAQASGATLVLRAHVTGGRLEPDGRIILNVGGEDPARLRARSFVSAAGLWSFKLMKAIEGVPPHPDLSLVKGNYFLLREKAPFSRLIYPVPEDGGLGVHFTLDMAGQAKFGPDTEWLSSNEPDKISYSVDTDRREAFADAIRAYWTSVKAEDLIPGYSGVRPKIAGDAYPDFCIEGPEDHTLGQHVFLGGIESPGLTSCLSIAQYVTDLLLDKG